MSTVTPASSSRPSPRSRSSSSRSTSSSGSYSWRMKTQPSAEPRGEHPEHEALEHEVRLLGEDLAVLEGAGLGLVRVADRVLGRGLLLRDQLPLRSRREARAAHAAQAGLLELLDQRGPCRARRRAPRAARGSRARRARTDRSGAAPRCGARSWCPWTRRAPRHSARCRRPRGARCSGPRAAARGARRSRAASTRGRGSRQPRHPRAAR